MKKETLKQVKGEIEHNKFMGLNSERNEKAYNFAKRLISNGIPLDYIYFNDFNCCAIPVVHLGKKSYRRFSDFDLKNCLKAWGIK